LGRIDDDKRATADRNRSSGFGWGVGGAACILFFMANWVMRSDAIALTPAVAGFVFAAVMAFSAVISRQNWLRYCAIGWLAFGAIYIVLPDPFLQTAALVLAATVLLIVPGLYLRRREGNSR
jgi:hypothetical protein